MNLTARFTLKIKLLCHGPLLLTGAQMLTLQDACSLLYCLLVGKKKLSSSTSEQNLAEGGDKIYMQHCQLPYLPHLTGEKIAVFHSCMFI